MTTVLLFDSEARGHSELYVRHFVAALADSYRTVVAVSDELAAQLGGIGAEVVRLGPAAEAASDEGPAFREAVRSAGADHAVHLFADAALPWLVRRSVGAAVTVLLFRPRLHYPSAYGMPLTARERLRAAAHEGLVALWRRRPEANAVLTLDEGAAARWSGRGGAPACWLPEPPVAARPPADAERQGCVMFGALARRKRIDLVADALAVESAELAVTLVGTVEPGYRPELERQIARMEAAGATVSLVDRRVPEADAVRALAAARCVVLPYVGHYGMSRVLVEAAVAGTPVVAHDAGLLGYLVRRHRLGLAVDCTDPFAVRRAVLELADDTGAAAAYAGHLRAFAGRYTAERFRRAVVSALRRQ